MKYAIAILATAISAAAHATPQLNFEGYDCTKYAQNAKRQEKNAQKFYNENQDKIEAFTLSRNAYKAMYKSKLEEAERQHGLAATCEAWQATAKNTAQDEVK
jgi:hypothetical protein